MTSATDRLTLGHATGQINPAQQWWALTLRGIRGVLRNGEFVLALVAPAFLAVCFYLPLRSIMNKYPGMDYAQYLMPIIALQSVGFAASSAAMRASLDGAAGINTRFRVLPMPRSIPVLARMSTNVTLLVVSLICATVASLIIGWRPHGGILATIGLFALALVIGVLFALLADGVGLFAGSPEATSQAMSLPTLILGMLSTGFVPQTQFPHWIRGFVRNQPVSQFTQAMRALNDGTATLGGIAPALWWCLGLAVAASALIVAGRWSKRS